jgi:hypothetical protein
LAEIVRKDPDLRSCFLRIVGGFPEDPGEFWRSSPVRSPVHLVPPAVAAGQNLKEVLRTLRNGFAHSHWFFGHLSAVDYWKKLRWDTTGATPFNLRGRPKMNYRMYIADGLKFKRQNFWALEDLRILVTQAPVLRYYLHVFLNLILNGSKVDIFGNLRS